MLVLITCPSLPVNQSCARRRFAVGRVETTDDPVDSELHRCFAWGQARVWDRNECVVRFGFRSCSKHDPVELRRLTHCPLWPRGCVRKRERERVGGWRLVGRRTSLSHVLSLVHVPIWILALADRVLIACRREVQTWGTGRRRLEKLVPREVPDIAKCLRAFRRMALHFEGRLCCSRRSPSCVVLVGSGSKPERQVLS